MSLQYIHQMLTSVSNVSGSLAKKELLKDYLKDSNFREVCRLAYTTSINFGIQKMPKFQTKEAHFGDEIFYYLKQMSEKKGATKAEKEFLFSLISGDPETYDVVSRIVKKDLRMGAAGRTINAVRPGLINITPYMRCSTAAKALHRISFDPFALCQVKEDGMFSNGVPEGRDVQLLTREGNKFSLFGELEFLLKEFCRKTDVSIGEMVAIDPMGRRYPRAIGNGILNRAIQGTGDIEEAKTIHYYVWDLIPLEDWKAGVCKKPYIDRWKGVRKRSKGLDKIHKIFTRRVTSVAQAIAFYEARLAEGKEGAVLKDIGAGWKDGSAPSPYSVKMKPKKVAEFVITGWYYGDEGKKFEKCLGGLNFESSCGLVKCNTGSGFKELKRGYLGKDSNGIPMIDESMLKWWDDQIGNIVEIKFDSLSTDKNRPDIYSLFLPIYKGVRGDKHTADDLEYLKEL